MRPIDLVLLIEELDRCKDLDTVGGVGYVSGLVDGVPDRPSIEHYVRIVKEKATLRNTIRFADDVATRCYEGCERVEAILAASAEGVRKLQEGYDRATSCGRIRTWEQIPTLDQLPTQEVTWLVEGIIPAGSVVLWAGESASYKTWLSLLLANAVKTGTDFLGRKTRQRPVLYLDRENPLALVQERCSMLGIEGSENFRLWGGWQADAPPMIGDSRLLEIAKTTQPLIIIDSLIRFHEADENSATEMGRVMAHIRSLANAGASILAQHHKPKAEGAHYRGSSDIKAGVDLGFAIAYDEDERIITVGCFKNRFGEEIRIALKPRFGTRAVFDVTSDPAFEHERQDEQTVRGIIAMQSHVSQSQIIEQAGLPAHKTRAILKRGEGTLWWSERGSRGRLDYDLIGTDSSFSAFQTYSSENLKSSSGELNLEGEL